MQRLPDVELLMSVLKSGQNEINSSFGATHTHTCTHINTQRHGPAMLKRRGFPSERGASLAK
jgi:hypothetical protein